MRAPCVDHLDTAKELLDFGVTDEGARTLVSLRRCAQTPGCEDWRNCDRTAQDAWRAASAPLPEAEAQEESPGER